MKNSNAEESFLFRVRRRLLIIRKHISYRATHRLLDYLADIRLDRGQYNKREKAILQYKNAYEGKACFVIGNGPSLKTADLERIRKAGYVCFASNKIYKCFNQTDWRPDFYACTDTMVFTQNWEEIFEEVKCAKFLSYLFKWHISYESWKKKDYFLIRYNVKYQTEEFPEDVVRMASGGSVTYVLIALAWMMGFKTIYLIGCDHTYKFYETLQQKAGVTETTETVQGDYFVKDYMKVGEKMCIGDLKRVERGYRLAKEHIEKNGGQIYNATRGGVLEVFERKDLDKILEGNDASCETVS